MCCFSGPVEDVAATRIFARMASPGRQILAYEMVFAARNPVAMILPLLHVHDGELHADAKFDHVLYAQGLRPDRRFEHEGKPLKHNLRNPNARLVVDLDSSLSRREMIGTLPNRDEWALLV